MIPIELHIPASMQWRKLQPRIPHIFPFLAVATVIAVASLLYLLFEMPVTRALHKRFGQSRVPGPLARAPRAQAV